MKPNLRRELMANGSINSLVSRMASTAPGCRTPSRTAPRAFLCIACFIMFSTAFFKLISIAGASDYLGEPAPLFPEVTWRDMLAAGAVIESSCGLYVLRHRDDTASILAVLWLSTLLITFKLTLWLIGYKAPCHCLGFFGDWLGVSRSTLDRITWAMLLFLFGGSLCSLALLRVSRKSFTRARLIGITALFLFLPATGALASSDFAVSGDEQALTITSSGTAIVQNVTFTVARMGGDWSIANTYADGHTKQYVAFVQGIPYTATWSLIDNSSAGLVLEKLEDLEDAVPEFARFLLCAFLVKAEGRDLTNAPVPFLAPRHPALHCYSWKCDWSSEPPHFPCALTFALDEKAWARVSKSALTYFFRVKASERFRDFKETQKQGALYSVSEWRQFEGGAYPAVATLTSEQSDEKQRYKRICTFKVNSIRRLGDYPLLPPLSPNSYVQHVLDHTNYLYQAAEGRWLPRKEVKSQGRIMRPAPPPPSQVTLKIPILARFLIFLLIAIPLSMWLVNRIGRSKQTTT